MKVTIKQLKDMLRGVMPVFMGIGGGEVMVRAAWVDSVTEIDGIAVIHMQGGDGIPVLEPIEIVWARINAKKD